MDTYTNSGAFGLMKGNISVPFSFAKAGFCSNCLMISMPFKLMLFVLADGWILIMQSLTASFSI